VLLSFLVPFQGFDVVVEFIQDVLPVAFPAELALDD
jgi:hypothetical protein